MPVLSLKDIDADLYRSIKRAAVDAGRTLRDECLLRLARSLPESAVLAAAPKPVGVEMQQGFRPKHAVGCKCALCAPDPRNIR
jgi:hypothetical protein